MLYSLRPDGTGYSKRTMKRLGVGPTVAALVLVCVAPGTRSDMVRAGVAPDSAPPASGWVLLEVGPLGLEGPQESSGRLQALADRARVILPRIEAELGVQPAAPFRIVLIPPGSAPQALPQDVRDLDAEAPAWAAGYLMAARRQGALRVAAADAYPYSDLASVLAHETTHMLLYDAAGPGLPRWFGEGVATGIERSWGLRDALVYSSSLLTGPLPPLRDLDAAFDAQDDRARAAYAAAFDFMLWTVRSYGQGVVREIVRQSASRPFPEAWRAATGASLERSEAQWRRGSLLLYRWIPALTGTTALWSGITVLALLAAARRRSRARRLLERWEAEGDGAED